MTTITQLTPDGIQCLQDKNPAVLQIIEVDTKSGDKQTQSKYIFVKLSDGFAYLDGVVIGKETRDIIDPTIEDFEFVVIRVDVADVLRTTKGKGGNHIVIKQATLITKLPTHKIGFPIMFSEYIKKNKINQKGSNKIPQEFLQFPKRKAQQKKKEIEKQVPKPKPKAFEQSKAQSRQKSLSPPHQQIKKPNKPIIKVQEPKIKVEEPKIKKQVYKPTNSYITLNDLSAGQQIWTICVRLITKSQPKKINTKKGPMDIMIMQVVDREGTSINITCFGQVVGKFQNSLQEENIYQISGGQVTNESFKSDFNPTKKITLNQTSVVKLVNDDGTIPTTEDRCITLNEFCEKGVGTQWNIICLIKDEGEIINFKSRAGKDMTKKIVVVCDPKEKKQVSITLWNDFAKYPFQKFPYYISNIAISEYQGYKQYGSTFRTSIKPMKQNQFKRYKDLSKIQFKPLQSGDRKSVLTNIKAINQKLLNLKELTDVLWSEIKVYINTVRTTGTMMYLGCPFCRKKVGTEESVNCQHCGKYYTLPKYRYILSLELTDPYGALWATAYDEIAQKIMHHSADQVHAFDQDRLKKVSKQVKYQQLKLLILSKMEYYNGANQIKHTINKIFEIDYQRQAFNTLKLIEAMKPN